MAFIGNTNTTQAFTPAIDYFSGTGSATAFTLSRPVASVAQVQVTIDNVAQNPSSAYTISGSTITFTSAPLSGTNNIYVYYTSPITQVIAPGQGTVGTMALVDASVTTAKLISTTGSGAVVLANSPTITTPIVTTTIGVGNATPSGSGAGITFPATQSASSDANTLDDYEEGTWTPTVTASAGSITTVSTGGQYRKIGSLVVLQFQYTISNNGTGINAINVSNLPFAGAVNTSAGAIREIAVAGVTGSCYLSSTTNLLLVTYNNGYPGGTSWSVVGTVCYQTT
jgi:hypothetical protein